ncbi:MAG: flagellar biosynthetic protein FliQ [Proteobacteria bacterium]|nr:MAG: flagellar biosynthetic protein FliQ [Pseudomonadota bacterium]
MNVDLATWLLQEAVRTSLWVAAPVLVGALVVGLAISVVQTATQLSDQTLAFVPKIFTVLMIFGLLFPWIMGTLVEFTRRMFEFAAQRGGP